MKAIVGRASDGIQLKVKGEWRVQDTLMKIAGTIIPLALEQQQRLSVAKVVS